MNDVILQPTFTEEEILLEMIINHISIRRKEFLDANRAKLTTKQSWPKEKRERAKAQVLACQNGAQLLGKNEVVEEMANLERFLNGNALTFQSCPLKVGNQKKQNNREQLEKQYKLLWYTLKLNSAEVANIEPALQLLGLPSDPSQLGK